MSSYSYIHNIMTNLQSLPYLGLISSPVRGSSSKHSTLHSLLRPSNLVHESWVSLSSAILHWVQLINYASILVSGSRVSRSITLGIVSKSSSLTLRVLHASSSVGCSSSHSGRGAADAGGTSHSLRSGRRASACGASSQSSSSRSSIGVAQSGGGTDVVS